MHASGNLFSIIIPTYNRSGFLPNAIKSVLDQTSDLWELIIVDDGSDDETFEVVKLFREYPKVQYYYQDNKGVSSARNYGATKAIGDFFIFLDSDDFIFPNLISELQVLGLSDYDLICWEVLKTWDGKQKVWKPKQLGSMYNNIKMQFLAGSVAYRGNIFRALKGFDEKIKFGENYELGLRISNYAKLRTKIINKPLSGYLLNSSIRTSDTPRNKLISYFHLYRKHRALYNLHLKQHSQ